MAHLQLLERVMGRETDYRDRTIDDHIDDFEDISVI
jgi:hypothetical protein